jgi:SnoaL-like domain
MPAAEPSLAKLPFRSAMEAGDVGAIVDTFAPDAVLHSPLTSQLAFTGRDQIRALTEVILEVVTDLRYTDEVHGEETAFLVSQARIGGQDIEIADHLRLDPGGKISEMTVFFRPLPAAAAALRLIGAGLGRRRGAARGVLISGMATPLAIMTKAGDPVGVRLVRSCL